MWLKVLISCAFFLLSADALDNGLARTPPMGWSTWQRFRCITDCSLYPDDCTNEELIKGAADLIVMDGYKEAGYEYIIIDDCWKEEKRDSQTNELVANGERFPGGMQALAEYVHSKGLKIGIYYGQEIDASSDYRRILDLDAQTFAKWGIDYVKYNPQFSELKDMNKSFPAFGESLNATKRPIVYACSWPFYQTMKNIAVSYEVLSTTCNTWRIWQDINDSYQCIREIIDKNAAEMNKTDTLSGPGHWTDLDLLTIGNYGLSIDQSRTQMAFWAISAAPLIMSTDLRNIRTEFKEILLNKAIIGVDQDPLGIPGKLVRYDDGIETWMRLVAPVVDDSHSYAVGWTNKRDYGAPHVLSFKLEDLDLNYYHAGYFVTDLFYENNLIGVLKPNKTLSVRINPTGTVFYKFTPNVLAADRIHFPNH